MRDMLLNGGTGGSEGLVDRDNRLVVAYTCNFDNHKGGLRQRLYETVGTMNDSWGYRPTDTHYKSVKEILGIKAKCASIGSNYMLNVGPDPLGRFPVAAIDILDGLAKAR